MASLIENWKFRCSRMIIKNFGYEIMLRKMPGHIREFNKLRLHLSHDLVFKIWRTYSQDFSDFGWISFSYCDLFVTISFRIPYRRIRPGYRITQVFPAKNLSKHAIFVWISTFEYFHVKIKTNCERYHLKSCDLSSALKPLNEDI